MTSACFWRIRCSGAQIDAARDPLSSIWISFRRRRLRSAYPRILPPHTYTDIHTRIHEKSSSTPRSQAGNFKTLLSAFKAASLIDMLRSPGQYTIFAPTDAAFKRLPAGSLDALFKDARTLKPFLCNHMMRGRKAANDILPGELTPLEGKTLRASLQGSVVMINDARSCSRISTQPTASFTPSTKYWFRSIRSWPQ